jgi:hypothetical protein
MKQLIIVFALGLISASLVITADADGIPAKRERPEKRKATVSQERSLLDLVRRAQESAEMAQAESRRAREQIESLQHEVASLRQALSEGGIEHLKSQVAELKTELARLQSAQTEPPVIAADSGSPSASLSAISNPLTAIPNRNQESAAIRNPQSEERLAKIEEQVEINSAQIKEQAQTKVESESRFRVRLFGLLLANTYLNSSDSSLEDDPLYARRADPGERKNNLGATLRQTKIGLAMTGPRMGSARLSAELETDFWGGTSGATDGDVLGFFRIRTATAQLDWDRTSIEIGQRGPIISPREPNSLAAVWIPPLANAGNLWQWRPQIAVEHRPPVGEKSELILQGAFLPSFGDRIGRSVLEGPPSYESRIAWRRHSDTDRHYEVGFGGHFGKRELGFGRNVNGYVVSGDWLIPLGSRFELSGEAYRGRSVSLGEESGSRIDRYFAATGSIDDPLTVIRGIRSSGGWIQLRAQARRDLEFNFAYGQEDPSDRDIRSGIFTDYTRFKNQVGSANFIYRMRSNFLMSFEYRRMWTDYSTSRFKNNHYNLGFGYLF